MASASYHGGNPFIAYSDLDHKRVKNLFRYTVTLMKLGGLVPLSLDKWSNSTLKTFLIRISFLLTAFPVFLSSHIALLYIKTTFDMLALGKFEDVTDCITMVVIYSFSCFGSVYWRIRSGHLMVLLKCISQEYRHHSLAGLTFVSAYPAYVKARNLTVIWMHCCMTGVSLWALSPLIMGKHALPLTCWYPFDVMQKGVFEIVYLLQYLGQLNCAFVFGTGSSLYVLLVLNMIGQFDVLFCSLKNLDFHAQLMAGTSLDELRLVHLNEFRVLPTTTSASSFNLITVVKIQNELPVGDQDELNQYIFAKEHKTDLQCFETTISQQRPRRQLKQTLNDSLKQCVHLHRFILECCDKMEELYNPYCLVKSLQITIQLCLLVFGSVAGERSTVRTLNQMQYLGLTVSELVMFTYCAELLRSHSMRCGEAFWRSHWWQHANSVRKDILIFLCNSRRVVKMTAGKFYPMDVDRLRAVMAQAFSFFTLLQKLAAKRDK